MRLSLIIATIAIVLAAPTWAGQIVELDLDGILGNGPDTTSVAVGSSVFVDIWYINGSPLMGVEPTICYGLTLTYSDYQYIPVLGGPAWFGDPPTFPSPNCVGFDYYGGGFAEASQPLHAVRLRLLTGRSTGLAMVFVDEANSWYTNVIDNYLIDGSISSYVLIGTTAANVNTWGEVKQLFR